MKLQKGKWYHVDDAQDTDKIALKFDFLSQGSKYAHFTEYVRRGQGWNKTAGSWFNKGLTEVAEWELDQILPIGHPDLKSNYIYIIH